MTPGLDAAACLATAWQATPEMGARVLIGTGLVTLSGWAAARRPFPGQAAFAALAAVMAAWIFFSVSEHAAVDAACKGSIALASWPIILAQPPLWALFLYQYLHGEMTVRAQRRRAWLLLPSLLLVAGALSNGWHGLWYGPQTALGPPIAGVPRMHYDYGPLFKAAVVVGYAWIVLAYALTLRGRTLAAAGNRTQWNAFLVMMSVPLAANAAYLGLGVRLFGVDPTSMAFAVVLGGFAWMIARNRVFTLVPLARRLLFAELPSPVLVLDPQLRVIEANVAGQQLAGTEPLPGTPLAQWPRFGALLAAQLQGGTDHTSLHLSEDGRWFDVQQRRLVRDGQWIGLLVQLHEVTAREQAHAAMRQRLDESNAEQRRFREQALRDPLTALWTRRALDEHFPAALADGLPLALVLLDLDHFKRVNDRWGHAVGDAVLRDFGAALRASVRGGDAVFRIGGEEFALLWPGVDVEGALRRLRWLHELVAARNLGGLPPGQTFSGGVAVALDAAADLATLLARADDALYRAKAEGRNRSCAE